MASTPALLLELVKMKGKSKFLRTTKSFIEQVQNDKESGTKYVLSFDVTKVVGSMDEDLRRLALPFYIEAHFENDSGKEPVTSTQEVKTPMFTVESPLISPHLPAKSLYEITIFIFKDKERKECLGRHHDLVFATAPARKLVTNSTASTLALSDTPQ